MWPDGGADGGTNVITDPDFEGDSGADAGWSALFGGTFAVVSTQSYCGAQSGELSNRTAFFNAMATAIPTTPATYNIAAWVLQDGTATATIAAGGVCTGTDGGQSFPGGPNVTALPNTWTFLSGSITVPAGCSTMQFFIGQPSSATVFPDIFADEVFVGP
jgi:hypothetical protein